MNTRNLVIIVLASIGFSGCATITSSEMQTVSLTAKTADGQTVDKAKCTLKNDKGDWEVVSPGFVNVHRSAEDLMVDCKKEGFAEGFLRAISRAAGGMFGNIVFGGVVGAVIDHSKGTGYNYPNELPVKMGESTTIDRRDERNPHESAPASPAKTASAPKQN